MVVDENLKYEVIDSTITFPSYRVYSIKAQFLKDGSFLAINPVFETANIILKAENSYSKNPDAYINLYGDVNIISGKMKIITSSLVYDVKKNIIYSTTQVKLFDENRTIVADSIISDTEFKNIKLKNERIYINR